MPAHHSDARTVKALAAQQREETDEPRGERYPVPSQSGGGAGRPGDSIAPHQTLESSDSPQPPVHSSPGGNDEADGRWPDSTQTAGDLEPLLCTPAQAAAVLQVRESWLRRRAARRLVPCTFLGKHLRFSRVDLEQIVADAACPTETTSHPIPDRTARSRQPRRSPARGRTGPR